MDICFSHLGKWKKKWNEKKFYSENRFNMNKMFYLTSFDSISKQRSS